MDSGQLKVYKYNGARAMVILHERHLISCVNTWREAKKINLILPKTDDSDYESLDTLLRHVLRSARGYMTWICDKLELPDPQINQTPGPELIESECEEYLHHLLKQWRLPLADILPDKFQTPVFTSRWGVEYCIDAMLEHAVMHPIRHEFQLSTLMEDQVNKK